MAVKVLEYYVNEETGKFIDSEDYTELPPSLKPAIYYGTECILKLYFVRNDENASNFVATDTFRLAGDKDWNHARGEGTFAHDYSGSVTSIEVANLTPSDTLPTHGVLRLTNGASEGETVYYTAYSIDGGTGNYIFTVNASLTYSYLTGDDCVAEDGLMIFSDTDKCVLTLPNIVEITINSDNHIFEYKLGDNESVWGYLQVERNTSGVSVPSIILNDLILFKNRVRINEGEPAENTYNFLTPTQLEQYYLKRDFSGNYPQKTPLVGADLIAINDSEANSETKYAEMQDIINLVNSSLAAHASSHEDGGSDEINVTGLSGELADPQTPKTHASTHKAGGSDEIPLDELSNPSDTIALNASTAAHGLLPKLSGNIDDVLDGSGAWNSGKANKVSGATADNIATLTTSGDLQDSGKKFNDSGITTGDIWTASKCKQYTDEQISQAKADLAWKDDVKAATTANITLSGEQTIGGISCVTGDRVLVKDQTAATENGIYVVDTGAWSRASDMDASAEFNGAIVPVQAGGTANGGTTWRCTTVDPVLGTDDINFTEFAQNVPDATDTVKGKVELATQAETEAKTDTTRAVTPAGLVNFLKKTGTEVQGAILYFDGTNWNVLAPGSTGEFLKTNGAGANPSWDSPSGSGDMLKSVYDTANLSTDIFKYAKKQALIFG